MCIDIYNLHMGYYFDQWISMVISLAPDLSPVSWQLCSIEKGGFQLTKRHGRFLKWGIPKDGWFISWNIHVSMISGCPCDSGNL